MGEKNYNVGSVSQWLSNRSAFIKLLSEQMASGCAGESTADMLLFQHLPVCLRWAPGRICFSHLVPEGVLERDTVPSFSSSAAPFFLSAYPFAYSFLLCIQSKHQSAQVIGRADLFPFSLCFFPLLSLLSLHFPSPPFLLLFYEQKSLSVLLMRSQV